MKPHTQCYRSYLGKSFALYVFAFFICKFVFAPGWVCHPSDLMWEFQKILPMTWTLLAEWRKHLFRREKTKTRLKTSSWLFYIFFITHILDLVSSQTSDPWFEGLRLPQTPPILNTDVHYLVSLYTRTHTNARTQTQTQISVLNVDKPRVERGGFLPCGLLQLFWWQKFGLHNVTN